MNVDSGVKKWVDEASYEQLLRRWRFAPEGDYFFQNDNGKYYALKMGEKGRSIGEKEEIRISKLIGWE